MSAPLLFEWTGEAMVPLPRFRKAADEAFVVHERYRMTIEEERSMQSHRHQFAAIREGWLNLPDHIATQFPTAEALRKHALIMTGFRKERKFATASREEARKLAAFLRPTDADDNYTIISVRENVVIEWKAESQSRAAMGNERFKASKKAVLDFIEGLIGVSPDTLAREAA